MIKKYHQGSIGNYRFVSHNKNIRLIFTMTMDNIGNQNLLESKIIYIDGNENLKIRFYNPFSYFKKHKRPFKAPKYSTVPFKSLKYASVSISDLTIRK